MARRTTQTKSKSKPKSNEVMSAEKWQSLKQFGSFVVPDANGGEGHKYSKDDTTSILPHGITPGENIHDWEYWVGKIRDIRAELHEDGTNTVKVKVQWYYSGKDVGDVVKSFDASSVSPYERILSDHYDIVEPLCFNGKTPVAIFDENDLEPPFISWTNFYQRYNFEYKSRTIKPKPGSSSCICNVPYDPNDDSPSSLMHFCPRPSCRRAYHHRCLLAAKSKESATALILPPEADDDDDDDDDDDNVIVANPPSPVRKNGRTTRSRAAAAAAAAANVVDEDEDVIVVSPTKPNAKAQQTRPTRTQKDKGKGKGKAKAKGKGKEKEQDPASTALSPDNPLYSRSFRLLTCSPDTDENLDLASLIPLTVSDVALPSVSTATATADDNERPRKKRRSLRNSTSTSTKSKSKSKSKSQPQNNSMDIDLDTEMEMEMEVKPSRTLAEALGAVPFDLLHVAEQPLVRGGAFSNGGVSGNIAFVTRARRLVYQIVEGASFDGENVDWESVVFGEGGDDGDGDDGEEGEEGEGDGKTRPGMLNAIVQIGKSKKPLLPFVCPRCKSAI